MAASQPPFWSDLNTDGRCDEGTDYDFVVSGGSSPWDHNEFIRATVLSPLPVEAKPRLEGVFEALMKPSTAAIPPDRPTAYFRGRNPNPECP